MSKLLVKAKLIIFLALLVVYSSFLYKDAAFLARALIAVAIAAATDSIITYFKTKNLTITDSSAVSGLIVGFVLSCCQSAWIFLLAPASAIISKHILRFNKRHLFNPAGFGILLAIILLGASTEWRGANLWYILAPFGLYFAYKIQKLEIVFSYMAVFLMLFGAHAVFQGAGILDALKFQNYFFIFVMLIEPKTSPAGKRGKMIFGAGCAALVFILTLLNVRYDAELCSLLLLNMFVPLLNKL